MRRPRFRLGTLMILIAVAAVPPALWLNRERARKRAYLMRHAMIAAAERGDVAAVRALLDQGADVDSITNGRFPWTPLMEAAFRGHDGVARLVLNHGANVNHEDLDAFTAITLAAGEGHWEIARMIAAAGGDVRHDDGYGQSAIYYAEQTGRPELVAELIELAGPDPAALSE